MANWWHRDCLSFASRKWRNGSVVQSARKRSGSSLSDLDGIEANGASGRFGPPA